MTYWLDTNAVTEPGRRGPDPEFVRWYDQVNSEEISISSVTMGELRRGIALMDCGARKSDINGVYTALTRRFSSQILPIGLGVAERWGDLSARMKRSGVVIGLADELIAATALAHDLALVTRNVRHFEKTGCRLLSPWSAVR